MAPEKLKTFENPYKIKPGEQLTLKELLTRFLDWSLWNRQEGREKPGEACNRDLFAGFLCCQSHMDFNAEIYAFNCYFFHLTHDTRLYREGFFSNSSMKGFLLRYGVTFDLEKVLRYLDIDLKHWQEVNPD